MIVVGLFDDGIGVRHCLLGVFRGRVPTDDGLGTRRLDHRSVGCLRSSWVKMLSNESQWQ